MPSPEYAEVSNLPKGDKEILGSGNTQTNEQALTTKETRALRSTDSNATGRLVRRPSPRHTATHTESISQKTRHAPMLFSCYLVPN
jgi:hypothetical protein